MYSILLVFIYLAFISLGLPDSLLGAGWPVMRGDLGVPSSYAGIVSMIISFCTIVSSLCTNAGVRRMGAGLLTACSVLLSAFALLGFSMSSSFVALCLCAIPYGLGAGAVDAALNHYVATHYAARHMSWLHCFWGVGVSFSPYVMSYTLFNGLGWSGAYLIVFVMQALIALCMFMSLPLWRAQARGGCDGATHEANGAFTLRAACSLPGVKYVLLAFFGYCAMENSAGLWASSYLTDMRHFPEAVAAAFASMFFLGITLGRGASGFLTFKFKEEQLIAGGLCGMLLGSALIALPFFGGFCSLVGLIVLGLSCAPVYPSVIHLAPQYVGVHRSQAVISLMMASAYVGSTLGPPCFGLLAQYCSIQLFPLFLFSLVALMLISFKKAAQSSFK